MRANPLSRRGRALEETYFRKIEEDNLQRRREAYTRTLARRELKSRLQVEENELLDKLIELGVTPETVAVFNLLPFVEVAWADGKVQPGEKRQILELARLSGVELDGLAHKRLQQWLDKRPESALFDAWREVAGISRDIDPEVRAELLSAAARAVAKAGKRLAIGSISDSELAVIEQIEAAVLQRSQTNPLLN